MSTSELNGTAEYRRLADYRERRSNWKKWGPYLSERACARRGIGSCLRSCGISRKLGSGMFAKSPTGDTRTGRAAARFKRGRWENYCA